MNTVANNPKVISNYTKVPNSLITNDVLSSSEKLIVIYILSFEQCYASQSKMSAELGISKSSVYRAIANLLKMKVLKKTHRDGWSYFYSVNPSSRWELTENLP